MNGYLSDQCVSITNPLHSCITFQECPSHVDKLCCHGNDILSWTSSYLYFQCMWCGILGPDVMGVCGCSIPEVLVDAPSQRVCDVCTAHALCTCCHGSGACMCTSDSQIMCRMMCIIAWVFFTRLQHIVLKTICV